MTRRWQRAVLTVSALLPLGVASAFAGPNGASVVNGGATVQGQGTANVVVNQSTQSAIINWQTFNIGSGETTRIYMPNSSSTQLDRVTGGQGPSQILGTLTSNGKVFLVNPDGILFGMGARINVGSLVATTNDIRDKDFVAGRYNFSIPGNPNASIVNLGTITAQTGGFAALVAPGVRNTGTIIAKLGTIALASGNAFTLDMYGDNLITLGVTDKVASQVIDVATGKPLKSLVDNEGTLKANGGTVVLTAVGARKIVDSVINTSGVIEADTIGTHNGKIVLGGPTETSKYAHAQKPTITVSGTLSAAGKRKGTTGGTIQITGRNIQVAGATINASGQAGGGTVLIGGDWGGGHPNTSLAAGNASASLQPYAVPNANTVSIDAATMIDASATGAGNGGKVIVWANQATTFLGTILAKGGAQSGNGGFVETSGGTLTYNGAVNTGALNGKTGTWLLDPTDLMIDSTGASTISRGLASNNVVVYTDANGNTSGQGTTSSGPGDIIVAAPISWSSGNTLTLDAYHDIKIDNAVTNSGAGSLVLRADSTGTGAGTVTFEGDLGRVNFSRSTGTVSIFYNPSDNPAGSNLNSTSYTAPSNYASKVVTNSNVANQLTAYMLVNTVDDLQNVENNLSGTYALGTSIDASATVNWNGGAGFVPIGNSSTPFTGTFNGNGSTISNVAINLPSSTYVGLFGYVGSGGQIADVGLIGGTVSGGSGSFGATGGLVAFNAGTVSGSYTTTTVSGGATDGVGGLVGMNSGTVTQSYATGTVSAGTGAHVGDLVGYNIGVGSITQSYASGAVSGSFTVGGLVGENDGRLEQSYAIGSVTASGGFAGGLAGWNAGTTSQTYATGAVHGTSAAGGLIGGTGGGAVTSSYWDTQTTGQSTSVGGGTGLTTAQFSNKANFSGWTFSTTAGGSGWVIVDNDGSLNNAGGASGATRPMLLSEWSTTISNPHQLQLVSLDLNANYTLANNLNLGPALSNPSDVWGPNGSAGFVPIGNGANGFTGIFNGNGNTISNLTINLPNSIDVGLFSCVGCINNGGVVENVGLIGGTVSGAVYVGALIGANGGTVTNAYATSTVNGSTTSTVNGGNLFDVGGLIGGNFGGTVTNVYATGAVSGLSHVGGLIGQNNTNVLTGAKATVTDAHATGAVTGTSFVGGLIGGNGGVEQTGNIELGGTLTNVYATGNVSGTSDVGGLVGSNGGTSTTVISAVINAYATGVVSGSTSATNVGGLIGFNNIGGTVTGSNASGAVNGGSGSEFVGGLIGSNSGGTVTNSYATGAVNGGSEVGGLVGNNNSEGTVTNDHATGTVSGTQNVGGLIGANSATVSDVYATGAVSGISIVGGLIGSSGGGSGTVSQAYATGTVSGTTNVGGLIGVLGSLGTGTVTTSYATGPVSGATNVGGLIGMIGSGGSVTQSYATGNVTATGASGIAGGLVGLNSGTISGPSWTTPPMACSAGSTCASGNVTVGSGGQGGGLVGSNEGAISYAFATGNVLGSDFSFAGGLVGLNASEAISQSFATGAVTVAGSGVAGGLIGSNTGGTITLSYATGAVNGGDVGVAGGLVGENFGGTISGSYATGAVTVGQTGTAGGLVGTNGQLTLNTSMVAGSIANSYATGAVVTGDFGTAGGLVGANFASITQSSATGAVTVGASSMGGGLVGINLNCCDANGNPIPGATISNSYATGGVFSAGINVMLGGLVGENEPHSVITNSQAFGNVTSTANLPPDAANCGASSNCLYVNVGGFVGANFGTITGTTWTTAPTSCAASFSCASGNVSVGSLGSGGGFAGYNEGIISYAFATGAVTGAAGLPDTVTGDNLFNNTTSIAGFVADNRGQISHSFATGDVGTAGTMWLSAGGFAGENKGTIDSSFATGAVMTGDNSTAGGFANGNGPDSNMQTCPSCFVGVGFNNSAAISNSQAFGNVTVGASSVAGGFSAGGGGDKGQSGGSFTNVTASGSVNAGHDSVVGGLVGVLFEGGMIANSSAQNPLVASSGPNSIIGGIVGLNLGSISDTTSTAPVSGTSDSYIGGITGINLGVVTGSSTDPDITGTGGNNIIGGIAGLNAGSIDNSTALVALSSGSGSDTGGVAGVNGSYSNTTATIAGSSFPNGTITNSSATGTGFGSQTGTAAPASPPELPSWLTGCSGSAVCTILIGGSLQSGSGGSPTPPSGPTNTPPPPTQPTITPNSPPTLIPTDTLANQQVLQFSQPVNFTTTNVAPPLVDPATLTSLNGSTPGNAGNALGGGGANGLNGNSTNGNTGTLANGRQGGNGAPPGVRLIDMPVLPLPPGSGVPPIGETRFLIDEVVLQFGPEVTPQQVADFARRLRLTIVSQYTIAALHRTVYTFRITRGQSVAEVIRQAERAGLHVAAQPNYTYQFTQDQGGSAAADPGDPAQYIVQKLQLGAVHRITEGKDVVVAVIDSQVDTKQPDFAGRIVESYDAGCGPNTPPDAHGTGMTGAIASHIGLLGVAPNARIIAICAFGGTGKPEATSAKIIRGVDYAIAHGAKIINMSFAGPRDPALAQELQIAREKGILIIAAAGNAGPKSPPLYPGADPNVMAVTATDEHDRLFIGANQGTYVAVAAPGVNILVPAPNGDVQFTTGTSVASANVSGVAALLMAEKARTPEEIRAILVDTAKHLGANGMNSQFGAGLVDPLKALRFVPPAIGRSSSAAPPVKLH